jgi:hypothetical protein
MREEMAVTTQHACDDGVAPWAHGFEDASESSAAQEDFELLKGSGSGQWSYQCAYRECFCAEQLDQRNAEALTWR